jgi:hemerythrin-like domain-containing protein
MLDEQGDAKEEEGKKVSPVEDLMREHGALNRILLIYDEASRRIQARAEIDPSLLSQAAKLIRDFIEGYHEKLEEEHVFPRLRKAGHLASTVDVLAAQHAAGRKLTLKIIALSTTAHFKERSDTQALAAALLDFNRMYRPHEAREDTVVFPAFKKAVTDREYSRLGEQFENKEHQLFGREGFERVVTEISRIEKALGIYDLSIFTPKG